MQLDQVGGHEVMVMLIEVSVSEWDPSLPGALPALSGMSQLHQPATTLRHQAQCVNAVISLRES